MQKKPMQKELNNENHRAYGDDNDLISNQIKILNSLDLKDLNFKVKKLNHLCLHFDPFDFDNQTNEVENILKEFNLDHLNSDPFLFTKIVLKLIDECEQIINKRAN